MDWRADPECGRGLPFLRHARNQRRYRLAARAQFALLYAAAGRVRGGQEGLRLDVRVRGKVLDDEAGGARGPVPGWTDAVYRAYDNRFATNDSNHRYMTSAALYDQMLAKGGRRRSRDVRAEGLSALLNLMAAALRA
jgi:hypothetical protein